MNLKPMSLNQNSNNETRTSNTSNKTPSWINPNPLSTQKLSFRMYKEHLDEAFEAVKKSSLPQEVIEYLTQNNHLVPFEGVLLKAGFAIAPLDFELKGYADAFGYVEYLGYEYVDKFLDAIAPFVKAGSYILVEGVLRDGYFEFHKWVFDGNTCECVLPSDKIIKRIAIYN